MAFTEKTTIGFGEILSLSVGGIVTGFIMFIIGTVLLFWNEGCYVKTQATLQEAEGNVVRVEDVSNVDPGLNGKLIHASAFADTKDVLTDELFGVSETAIAIDRNVEYYQYEERASTKTKDKIGGGQEQVTTYTYDKRWVSKPVNSADFKDADYTSSNFVLAQVEEKTERAKNVTFGAYKLPPFIISSISGNTPAEIKLSPADLQKWEKVIAANVKGGTASPAVHVNGNVVYFGKSDSNPGIGDVRITLTKILPADISIIAKVNGSTFEQYITKNGKSFSKFSMGNVSPENMFAAAHSSNSTSTWIFRFIGVFLVIGGLRAMFGMLIAIFRILPFVGDIVNAGVGLICAVVGFAWSLLIISIAWLFYRPLIGILLLAVAVGGIWYLKQRGKKPSPAA